MNRSGLFPALLCALLAAPPGLAQLAVNTMRPLVFGKFIAASGGTVSVDPHGVRTPGGGVLLLNASGGAAATFQVGQLASANAGKSYIVSLPENGNVVLNNGPHSMLVNNFFSYPSAAGLLSGGLQSFSVGATLVVAPNQPAGNYSGTFSVTLNYQ